MNNNLKNEITMGSVWDDILTKKNDLFINNYTDYMNRYTEQISSIVYTTANIYFPKVNS